ncbi:TetR/AcrR family transcriptional regulator [Pararhizobium sp. BT-229]|uniref:TetR/AcrR family transcriptional regulator n=1 Tax=Pararhizobium sp. BT-229 TaxID=2986923 RepID=UPI0021F79621|nr:TetR/AcrR family transcriptional regulator [Pararhizobium sp. BT-229]MCV9961901.1 TetR/AcrR family transcriptional regulator [Pararhizobium sp. BT-229]
MTGSTRGAIMDAAERLLRSKGYAAFSYADLAESVGIRKASIHHHFPTKEDLGVAIVEDYVRNVRERFSQIEAASDRLCDRLAGFREGFRTGAELGMLPLCGALAAEMAALPSKLQFLTREFFDLQLKWLTKILDDAAATGQLPQGSDTPQKAYLLLSLMEGSSFIDWAMQDGRHLDTPFLLQLARLPLPSQ